MADAHPESLGGSDLPFGVALSGGGFRSALFGLGVLQYLVASNHAHRLTTITSVSGGSYTSARALLARIEGPLGEGSTTFDLQDSDEDDLLTAFRPFVRAMTRTSVWFRPPVLAFDLLMLALALVVVLGGYIAPIGWWMSVIALILLLVLIPTFGRIMARAMWRLLFPEFPTGTLLGEMLMEDLVDRGGAKVRREKTVERVREATPRDQSIHHVFCATDLHYTRFTYLTNRLVWNHQLGHGNPGKFTIKNAVDASSAIPPIFAPVPLDTDGFLRLPPDAPRKLLSVDGGVYDTLATEWFDIAPAVPPRVMSASAPPHIDPTEHVLVVDGSAPAEPSDYVPNTTFFFVRRRLPFMWWIASHIRSAKLAFSNWDRRNFETIENDPNDNKMAISVLQTPFSLHPTDSQREALARRKVDWGNVVRDNRRVKTRPTKLDEGVASMLVYHGYVMAWVIFTKSGGTHTLPDPEEFKDRWFG